MGGRHHRPPITPECGDGIVRRLPPASTSTRTCSGVPRPPIDTGRGRSTIFAGGIDSRNAPQIWRQVVGVYHRTNRLAVREDRGSCTATAHPQTCLSQISRYRRASHPASPIGPSRYERNRVCRRPGPPGNIRPRENRRNAAPPDDALPAQNARRRPGLARHWPAFPSPSLPSPNAADCRTDAGQFRIGDDRGVRTRLMATTPFGTGRAIAPGRKSFAFDAIPSHVDRA